VVPRLALVEASRPLALDRVEACVTERASLPRLEDELPERVHGLLGASFLSRFRVVIDYRDQVLWLEPVAQPGGVLPGPHVGLRLEWRWGALRVAGVVPDSPAARAGARPGDEVLAIGDSPAARLSPATAEGLLLGEPGTTVTVTLRREGVARRLDLRRAEARAARDDR
jgi:predicted metalloprotease with PDZ domain